MSFSFHLPPTYASHTDPYDTYPGTSRTIRRNRPEALRLLPTAPGVPLVLVTPHPPDPASARSAAPAGGVSVRKPGLLARIFGRRAHAPAT